MMRISIAEAFRTAVPSWGQALLGITLNCPQNGTAALKGLIDTATHIRVLVPGTW